MPSHPKISPNILQQICNVVGDTHTGLTGSEIGRTLASSRIEDPEPTITKRDRLYVALSRRQEADKCSNNVLAYLQTIMDPVSYSRDPDIFRNRRDSLNQILAFAGYKLQENGNLEVVDKVDNLDEAQQRANRLRAELSKRKVHHEVLKYCNSELLQSNYFHAVFEAVKGIADRIREMTGLTEDGAELIDLAFKVSEPFIILNSLRSKSELSEHTGFMNLLKGTFGMFRNTTAHSPKIKWPIPEEDAFDLLTLVSLVHKKLDRATPVRRA